MRIRLVLVPVVLLAFGAVAPAAAQSSIAEARYAAQQAYRRAMVEARELYQGRRGPEQSDTFSRKYRIGRDGRVSIQNVAGEISVGVGPGDEVSIEAVKRTRGDRSELNRVDVIVEEHAGRVDVRTEHGAFFRDDHVSVDFTVIVPEGASVEMRSVSGNVKVNGVKGIVRAQSVSGNVVASNAPRVEYARTVSGDVELTGVSMDSDMTAQSISGSVHASGLKARALDISTVSGEVSLRDANCERLNARSVSGGIDYNGSLTKNGRYDVSSHSGSVRFTLTSGTGFELNTTSFSGSLRSEFPLTLGGQPGGDVIVGPGSNATIRRGRGRGPGSGVRAVFGDGSASLSLRTFSGDIVIAKR
jgi:DUF4097 and DUF4098 domain-containing protein YvlB